MATLSVTDEQVVELIRQLPPDKKSQAFLSLVRDRWPEWTARAGESAEKARVAARARGQDWDAMTDEQRERFIDDVLHEKS